MIAKPTAAPGFQEAFFVEDPTDCYFYHTTDLPKFGVQTGYWDLRNDVDNYLGNQDFQGKTVIDVGTASGFLCFEMEKRGASVVAFDRPLTEPTDDAGLIPFYNYEEQFGKTMEQAIAERLEGQLRYERSFWLTHRLLDSKARLYHGNVYDGPKEIGTADYCFFGCILLHLRDPLLALASFARFAREKIIITETYEEMGVPSAMPIMFLRACKDDRTNPGTWWYIAPSLLRRYLEVLGFSKSTLTYYKTRSVQGAKDADMYTIVAER